jgi:hypothetical protein
LREGEGEIDEEVSAVEGTLHFLIIESLEAVHRVEASGDTTIEFIPAQCYYM